MWQPSASFATLKQRASILKIIRDFFAARDVLEVETPLLCHTSVTDPYTQSIPAGRGLYLQTSPEYAMKRLLAAGYGAIYQINKAFRDDECGRFHNPEFTMLEWYRPGFDHHALMQEMDALLQAVLQCEPADKVSYAEMFAQYLNINPHTASIDELKHCATANQVSVADNDSITNKDTWMHLLLTHCIEPHLGKQRPLFIYDFPASQATLSRIQPTNPPVASRFEVYINGLELANGFHELQNAEEQRNRFITNQLERKQLGLPEMAIDEYLIAALTHGLPDCAGVALGIDRLVMLATNRTSIAEVISFDAQRV